MSEVLTVNGLSRSYPRPGGGRVPVLREVSFSVRAGEAVAIIGPSGSGKSTLLHAVAGLSEPEAGRVTLAGVALDGLSPAGLDQLRNRQLGFIYQFHHLLPEFTALENAAMPLLVARLDPREAGQRALRLLTELGLGERAWHLPGELSGGERQRVALARALIAEPACLLADEPTGNLDADTAAEVFGTLLRAVRGSRSGAVIVTHDTDLAGRCDRVLTLRDGTIA